MLNPKVSVRKDILTGSYFLEYHFRGKRRRPRVGSSQEEAEELAVEFRKMLRQGLDPQCEMERTIRKNTAGIIPLKDFFPIFIERHGQYQSSGMQLNYQNYFNNVGRCPDLVSCPLKNISKGMVLEYLHLRQKEGIKAQTAAHEGRFINSMLNRAVEWEYLEMNPITGIKFPHGSKKRDIILTVNQAKALLEELPEMLSNMAELAILTGWRKNNIRLLKIEQLNIPDFGSAEASLVTKGNKSETKPLSENAMAVIRRAIGDRTSGFVFLNKKTGSPYTRSGFNAYDKAVRKLNLTVVDGSKLRFHDLRHACAGFLKNEAGASLDDIRVILGHQSRQTTDRYITYTKQVVGLLNAIPRLR